MKFFSWCCGLLLAAVTLRAETVYVEYNPGCIDRLEYLDNNNGTETRSYAYHLRSGDQRLAFNTGADIGSRVPQAPAGMLSCKTDRFDDAFLDAANTGTHNIYVVQRNGSGYDLIPVRSVSRVRGADGSIDYRSGDTRFVYDVKTKKAGNWASADSPNKVFHEGNKYRFCYRAMTFRSIPDNSAAPFTEMVVIPEIGIVQTRTGLTPDQAKRNTRNLVKVNNVPFGQYVKAVCAGENPSAFSNDDLLASRGLRGTTPAARKAETATVTASIPATPAEVDTPTTQPELVPEMQATTTTRSTNGDCNVPDAPGVHVVRRSETLYGIARQHGITVDQLKRWNKLTDNTIKPCMPLNVVEPISVVTPQPAPSTPNPEPSPTTTIPAPRPAPTTTPKQPVPGTVVPRWADTNGTHVVQSGEKVSDLAAKYGYTEARFRWMNGLDADDQLLTGQVLRTKECEVPERAPELRAMPFNTTEERPTGAQKYDKAFEPKGENAPVRRVHVVKKNETLYSISRKYSMQLSELQELNQLKPGEVIFEGMTVYLN